MADHCLSFALSDPRDGQFQQKCFHDHSEICSECFKLNEVLDNIEAACTEIVSEEEREVYGPIGKERHLGLESSSAKISKPGSGQS